jgi:two-component system, NarL family, response regulator LiaR
MPARKTLLFNKAHEVWRGETMITLVFADNHSVVRAGVRTILSVATDIQIVGEAENGVEVQKLVERLRPRILLLGLKMPGLTPAEIGRWARVHFPETAILVLTAYDQDAYLVNMMDAGAVGWLNMEASAEKLIEAVRRAANGEILFDQEQLARAELWRKVAGEKWKSLSKRQKQVLQLLAQGTTKVDVTERLGIHLRMVDYHISKFLKKLKFKSLTEAVNWLHKYFPHHSGSITS